MFAGVGILVRNCIAFMSVAASFRMALIIVSG